MSALIAAALGVLNYGHTLLKDRRKKAADGTYLAMRLAVTFEAYASACADVLVQNQVLEAYARSEPQYITRLPKLPDLPEDAEGWKALSTQLADLCLTLGNRVAGSQGMIQHAVDYDQADVDDTVILNACNRGLDAWALALRLRSAHRLDPVELVFDFGAFMLTERDRVSARREKRKGGLRAAEPQ